MLSRSLAFTVLVAVVAGAAPPALAQRAPDMTTLDRGDGITKLGLDGGLVGVDALPFDTVLWFELHGQYVTPSGLGFYGAAPLWLSMGDDDDPQPGSPGDPPGDQDGAALGNLEAGGLYVISGPKLSWVFRGGVALPTASDGIAEGLTRFFGVWPRLTDWALIVPEATYLRASASPLYHSDRLFLRADLGFDLVLVDDTDLAPNLLRANFAGGVDLGLVALSLELVNLVSLDDFDDDGEESMLHTLTFAVRFMTRRFEPFIALGAPLDDSARAAADWYLSAGLQFPL